MNILTELDKTLAFLRNSNRAGGTITGRATMVNQICSALEDHPYRDSWFLPAGNHDLLHEGILGVYKGAVIIKQNDPKAMPANVMMVEVLDNVRLIVDEEIDP